MSSQYYSERQGVVVPLNAEDIGPTFWNAFLVVLEKMTNEGLFAEAFPDKCQDGRGLISEGSSVSRAALLAAEIGPVELSPSQVPTTLIALDVPRVLWPQSIKAQFPERPFVLGSH